MTGPIPDDSCQPPTVCAFEVELLVQKGPSAGERHVLQRFPAFVGRGNDADICLVADSDDRMLSRRHLKVSMEGGRIVIVDLSTNGTWVGQHHLRAGEAFSLSGGEPVWLGPRTMIVLRPLGASLFTPPLDASPPPSPDVSLFPAGPPPTASPTPPAAPVEPTASEAAGIDLTIDVLGEVRVQARGLELKVWPARKAMVLLATLADSRGGRVVSAERLIDQLWPDDLADAKAALQATVSRLRRAFRSVDKTLPDPVDLCQGGYCLSPAYHIRYDARTFEVLSEEGARLLAAGQRAEGAARLEEAVALYRGSFLDGYTDDWVQTRRRALEGRYFDAVDTLAEVREGEGSHAQAVRLFEGILEHEPCRERSQLGLMRNLAASGKRDEALRRYHDFVTLLKKDLNLAPTPELVMLYESLRAG